MAAEGTLTPGEYIRHHLVHLTNVKQKSIVDFSVINIDSVVVSSVLGLFTVFVLWLAARKATAGVPGRFQAAVEMLVEMVDQQAKSVIHNAQSRKLVAPMALTVFVWIFMMNFMDMLPVDLLPQIWHTAGPAMGYPDYLRVVPTADLSTTLGLSVSVLLLCL
ncbi:MAG: F0F1 ATP synthase subunit A, partial [Hydrogenophaga sp.]|nr:F0F1 ATP synthase subunit A [Hydrogenophaga sp.]